MTNHATQPTQGREGDVSNPSGTQSWFYSDAVKEHFFHPQNFVMGEVNEILYNAVGKVGSPACGDELRVWMRVDQNTERIVEFRWKTFGCGSAIASTSMASVMLTENGGMTLEEARQLRPQSIMARLGGLPARKFHCSVLCDKAVRDAINDYYRRTKQEGKVVREAARVVCSVSGATDRDIEEAVLEGAVSLERVQQKTKAGVGNPSVLPAIEDLIRFYREKYFGADAP